MQPQRPRIRKGYGLAGLVSVALFTIGALIMLAVIWSLAYLWATSEPLEKWQVWLVPISVICGVIWCLVVLAHAIALELLIDISRNLSLMVQAQFGESAPGPGAQRLGGRPPTPRPPDLPSRA